jgi:hypothetical protein
MSHVLHHPQAQEPFRSNNPPWHTCASYCKRQVYRGDGGDQEYGCRGGLLHAHGTSSTIALAMSKTFLFRHLFNEDGEGHVEFLEEKKMIQTMFDFEPMCSFNIDNFITSFKHCTRRNMGSIDYIFMLNAFTPYNYIQDSCFLGQ